MTTVLDARGLSCPLPVLRAKKAMRTLALGEVLEVHASDPAALTDMPSFCRQTGNTLLESREGEGEYVFLIRRDR